MRHAVVAAALCAASALSHAGTAYLTLTPTSPTTVAPGGTVSFTVEFNRWQEQSSSDTAGGEPSPDLGFQEWFQYGYAYFDESLVTLDLQLASTAGHGVSLLLTPNAVPGTDFTRLWDVTLSFAQAGHYTVQASALADIFTARRSGQTVAYRECVGFDNSVQCTTWTPVDQVFEDTAETLPLQAVSAALAVQVVPEPATAALWLLGLAGLGRAYRRSAQAMATGTRGASAHISS